MTTEASQQPDRHEAFVQTIKRWTTDHLARCLIAPDVNEAAKEAIRAELLGRGVDVDKATAQAVKQTTEDPAKPMPFTDKLLLWGPTIAIVLGLAIGLYLFARFT